MAPPPAEELGANEDSGNAGDPRAAAVDNMNGRLQGDKAPSEQLEEEVERTRRLHMPVGGRLSHELAR